MCDAFKVIDVFFGSKDLFGQPSNEPVVKRTTGPIWWYRDFHYCLYSNKMRSLFKKKKKISDYLILLNAHYFPKVSGSILKIKRCLLAWSRTWVFDIYCWDVVDCWFVDFLPCSDQAHLCLKNAMNFCTWYQLLLKMELWHCMNLEGWKFWLLKYLLFQMVIIISILESGLNSTDGLVGIMLMISTHILEPIHMQIALLHTEYVWKSEVWVCRNCSLLECFVMINHLQCFASSFVFFLLGRIRIRCLGLWICDPLF